MDKKRPVTIYSARKAARDYKDKLAGFQEIQSRMRIPSLEAQIQSQGPVVDNAMSLSTYMRSQGIPVSFSTRSAMAKSMGMHDYTGSQTQDNDILMGLQGRDTTKAQNQQVEREGKNVDREYGLKEKELQLKEQELNAAKAPSADEVADSLLKQYRNK